MFPCKNVPRSSACRSLPRRRGWRQRAGAALLLVLVALAFLAFVVTEILSSGMQRLVWESQRTDHEELRREAFSALESTLGVLGAFAQADGALYGPQQGWADPLDLAEYEAPEGLEVSVTVRDESGFYGLQDVASNTNAFSRMLQNIGVSESESQNLAACLADWVDAGDTPRLNGAERESYPEGIAPPNRPLQSLDELRHVKGFDTVFFNEDGTGNELWARFTACFSLLSATSTPNINTAPAALLEALGEQHGFNAETILAARNEGGDSTGSGGMVYRNAADLGRSGLPSGLGGSVGFNCQRLRVIARVSRGAAATVVVDTLLDTTTGSSGGTAAAFPFTILQQRVNAMLQE